LFLCKINIDIREAIYRVHELQVHQIVLDINMPRENGFEVLGELNARGQKCEKGKQPGCLFQWTSFTAIISLSAIIGPFDRAISSSIVPTNTVPKLLSGGSNVVKTTRTC
jgi:CheY-like chemotaxis protein